MVQHLDIRRLARLVAFLTGAAFAFSPAAAFAQSGADQDRPGNLADRRAGWRRQLRTARAEDLGGDRQCQRGALGRPVKLVYYDDQSSPPAVRGLYQKVLDVYKVDVVIGGFGTNMLAPAMPVLIQKESMLIGLFGVAVNAEFHYPKYFSMMPLGPEPKAAMSKSFFETAVTQNPEPETPAIVAAEAEFPINASEGARENTKALGFKIIYDKRYPPATTDFAPIARAIHAANPDIVASSIRWTRSASCARSTRSSLARSSILMRRPNRLLVQLLAKQVQSCYALSASNSTRHDSMKFRSTSADPVSNSSRTLSLVSVTASPESAWIMRLNTCSVEVTK